ncbi:uncharacterized protein LOC129233080 [Uloborus diversus]|uniref:uncharacterized protein LOC129233080 n=1 Tax=Uloborus diversus TaxID=327109 RepID=UPI0024091C5A|nr:uncharacterized protein LOC129233080 [Uloborus diversus]
MLIPTSSGELVKVPKILLNYLIVEFLQEKTVTTVPSSWVRNNMCAWPPFKGLKKISDLVKAGAGPEHFWERLKVRVMKGVETYEEALYWEETACYKSDMGTEVEEEAIPPQMKRRNKNKEIEMLSSSSGDESMLSDFPDFPKKNLQQTSTPAALTRPSTSFVSSPNLNEEKNRMSGIFMKKVMRLLESMQQDIKEIKEAMKTPSGPLPSLPVSCPSLPCQEPENLAELETVLQDEALFHEICNFLSCIGGSSVKDTTRRILSKLISSHLALKYNWKGTRGVKLGFSSFEQTNKLIFGAVRNNLACSMATEVEVQTVIKRWLMYAKDRDGGRSARGGK